MIRVGFGVTAMTRSAVRGGIDGIGSYTRDLMLHLNKNPAVDVVPVAYGHNTAYVSSANHAVLKFGKYMPLAALSAALQISFPGTRILKKSAIDLIHATDHLIPRHRRIPVVATLHDAIPLSHPQWSGSSLRNIKNSLRRQTAQWASQVITISEYSKQEIMHYFSIREQKISVIPNGVDERWFQPLSKEVKSTVLDKYALPQHYFLTVGTLQPRKNVARIVEAWQALPAGIRHAAPLVVVGRAGWQCENLVQTLTALTTRDSLRWLRHIPEDDLFAVLKGATALVFPSLCEGFGLPVVEAFAAGTPVITSNTTSLPEVAADAALLVNPLDTAEIAAAMQTMLEQPELAEVFRRKGKQRALTYSWNRTAAMTIDVYRNTLLEFK